MAAAGSVSDVRAARRNLMVARTAVLVAGLLLLSGCQATARVTIDVARSGAGTVSVVASFDDEAVSRLGGDLSKGLRLEDVTAAGWTVGSPVKAGAITSITATRRFASPAGLTAIMDQLGGSSDLFPGWKLSTENSFGRATYKMDGTVRLTGALDQFSDAEVAGALDGLALGRSPEELAKELADNPEALALEVQVSMPADLESVSGLTQKDQPSSEASKRYVLGNGEAVDSSIAATAVRSERSAVGWIIAGAAGIVGGLLLLAAQFGRGRRRRQAPRPRAPRQGTARPASR